MDEYIGLDVSMKETAVAIRRDGARVWRGKCASEPRRETAVVSLSTEQLHWILDGIDIDAMVRHPVRQYQIAG